MIPAGGRRARTGHARLVDKIVLGLTCAAMLAASGLPALAQSISVSELKDHTHIHGLAVDRLDPSYLLIATHHGLFRAAQDGKAELVSVVQDFMGFTPDPTDPATLFASGHPSGGGNLGFIASADNGRTWTQISPGVDGPVDFHQMTVSASDPKVIYGAYGSLQISRDAGKTWSLGGPLPEKLIDLAASAKDVDTIYAATEGGLLVSPDGGTKWQPVIDGAPVSLVEMAGETLYAFVVGRGLVRSAEGQPDFTAVGGDWNNQVLLHLAVDAKNPDRIFVASHHGDVLMTTDGGTTWKQVGS